MINANCVWHTLSNALYPKPRSVYCHGDSVVTVSASRSGRCYYDAVLTSDIHCKVLAEVMSVLNKYQYLQHPMFPKRPNTYRKAQTAAESVHARSKLHRTYHSTVSIHSWADVPDLGLQIRMIHIPASFSAARHVCTGPRRPSITQQRCVVKGVVAIP